MRDLIAYGLLYLVLHFLLLRIESPILWLKFAFILAGFILAQIAERGVTKEEKEKMLEIAYRLKDNALFLLFIGYYGYMAYVFIAYEASKLAMEIIMASMCYIIPDYLLANKYFEILKYVVRNAPIKSFFYGYFPAELYQANRIGSQQEIMPELQNENVPSNAGSFYPVINI